MNRKNLYEEQTKNRKILIRECLTGETQKEVLVDNAHQLIGEAEIMYFKRSRDFLKTSLAHRIMNCKGEPKRNQISCN